MQQLSGEKKSDVHLYFNQNRSKEFLEDQPRWVLSLLLVLSLYIFVSLKIKAIMPRPRRVYTFFK